MMFGFEVSLGHVLLFTAQLEIDDACLEGKRFVNVAHLKCDVIEA